METFSIFVFRQIDGVNIPVSKAELTTALTMSVGDYTYNTIQIAADE